MQTNQDEGMVRGKKLYNNILGHESHKWKDQKGMILDHKK